MEPISVYIHIPYCERKCPYCDFNTYAVGTIPEQEYTRALLAELRHYAALPEWNGRPAQSIYFGGGTPSLFDPKSIESLVREVRNAFPSEGEIEITLEANPGALSEEKLAGIYSAGVNRISLGAQSFHPRVLETLGRTHSPDDIRRSVETARKVGFTNLNIDLIYGVPGQSLAELSQDFFQFGQLLPEHVSAYGLTIEKGTPFFQQVKCGILELPPEQVVLDMMRTVNETFTSSGYEHYEISNFARPGKEAKHNGAYWDGCDYLGLGAGAHSFRGTYGGNGGSWGSRWANLALPYNYIARAISRGSASGWSDSLSKSDAIFEYFFLGLRKLRGVSLKAFECKFNMTVDSVYPNLKSSLIDQGLLTLDDDLLRLSEEGLYLADSVIEAFAEPNAGKGVGPGTSTTERSVTRAPLSPAM